MSMFKIGTRVHVFSADHHRDLGDGTVIKKISIGHINNIPVIRLDKRWKLFRRNIRGYECWWAPVEWREKAKKELADEG